MNTTEARTALNIWLREYAVWKELASVLTAGEASSWKDALDFSGEPSPEVGQIRLWPAAQGRDAPFYGVLVSPEYGSWGVLPVSSLAVPGTPEELRVMEEPPVQVVQGWNRRRIAAARARESWFAGMLPETERFRVDLFLSWCRSGEPLPPALEGFVGPPRVHPLDPRYVYLDEERERADHNLGAASVWEAKEEFPLARAAEPDPDYDHD